MTNEQIREKALAVASKFVPMWKVNIAAECIIYLWQEFALDAVKDLSEENSLVSEQRDRMAMKLDMALVKLAEAEKKLRRCGGKNCMGPAAVSASSRTRKMEAVAEAERKLVESARVYCGSKLPRPIINGVVLALDDLRAAMKEVAITVIEKKGMRFSAATAANRRDPEWRRRTGFDNISRFPNFGLSPLLPALREDVRVVLVSKVIDCRCPVRHLGECQLK